MTELITVLQQPVKFLHMMLTIKNQGVAYEVSSNAQKLLFITKEFTKNIFRRKSQTYIQ